MGLIWYLTLLAVQLVGIFFTLLGLPGLWLMVAALAGFAWVTKFAHYVGWPGLITVIVLAAMAEIMEFVAGSAGAKRAGASRRGMMGAMIGALFGGFIFSIPVPILGTIFGVCLGAFLGAALVEMGNVGDAAHAGRIGWGAAKGRFFGIMLKLFFGVIIFIFTVFAAFPI